MQKYLNGTGGRDKSVKRLEFSMIALIVQIMWKTRKELLKLENDSIQLVVFI